MIFQHSYTLNQNVPGPIVVHKHNSSSQAHLSCSEWLTKKFIQATVVFMAKGILQKHLQLALAIMNAEGK